MNIYSEIKRYISHQVQYQMALEKKEMIRSHGYLVRKSHFNFSKAFWKE